MRASEGGEAAARAHAFPLWPQAQGLARGSAHCIGSALWKNQGLLTFLLDGAPGNPRLACWWTGCVRARGAADSPFPGRRSRLVRGSLRVGASRDSLRWPPEIVGSGILITGTRQRSCELDLRCPPPRSALADRPSRGQRGRPARPHLFLATC